MEETSFDSAQNGATDNPRREAVLRCAREAFVTQGYAAAKVEPIARDAGVSTATLYALFDGKAGLFSAVIDHAADEFADRVRGFDIGGGDAREQLLRFCRAYADFMGDPLVRSVFRLVISERRRFNDVANRFVERGRSDFGAVLIRILEDLVDAGGLAPIAKPSRAAGQLLGMIEHTVFFVPLVSGEDLKIRQTRAEIVEDAVETFLARYGARQG
ncbi:TetR/AcrR family transcriptional regulator [Brevundimonas sp. NPDC092305]|uniref:TetR/AcrR family transcriptional regulator n=1 Tax=Brevundimonas sp. NPDC092305 TaxID=3363957 RepID=UPI0037F76337